jgi:hypothetical protein
MKLKVFIIKKQQLIWAAIILAVVVIAAILLIVLKSEQTLNFVNQTRTTKADIDNDGRMDSIVTKIDEKTKEYSIEVISGNGKGYSLVPDDKNIKTFGFYDPSWPMRVDARDIDSDGRSEIILQSSDDEGPILYVFDYNNSKLSKAFSGRYSVFGNLKNPVDKSDIIILGTKSDDTMRYTYLNSRFKGITPPTSLTLGKDALSSLIGFIEAKEMPAFNVNIESKHISKILKGSFLDSDIKEAKYTKYSIPSECTYLVRTSAVSGSEKSHEAYIVTMSLMKYDAKSPEYKITNIAKAK